MSGTGADSRASQGTTLGRPVLCYTDTGGTFTDTLLVDEYGTFAVGKAPTNATDPPLSYFNSIRNANSVFGMSMEELYSGLSVVGYGQTSGINALITRTGAKTGMLITKGFEQVLLIERGVQTWVGLPMTDVIHARTHGHREPLVPFSLTKGVTERVDCLGQVFVPLHKDEVRQGVQELIDAGVEAIAICFLFSWLNPVHEREAKEIAQAVCHKAGKDLPIYLRVDVCPRLRELPSVNSTIVEAYISQKARRGLYTINDQIKAYGFKGNLEVMLSSGGLGSIETTKAVETLESGPVGGPVGARYVGQLYGIDNIIGTDVGGTSFDVSLVTRGTIGVNREAVCHHMLLGTPIAEVDSIGAGGGTLAFIDPLSGRLTVGPASAGAVPGPVAYDLGGEVPTVTDCDVALGYIDPTYFLGGRIKLNKEKAIKAIREKVAEPLGLDVSRAAMGIRELIDTRMRDAILGMVLARGLDISDYHVMGFGGAGPTHVAGYTAGLRCKGVFTVPFAAAFCAFGAAAADYEHQFYRSTNIVAPPTVEDETKAELAKRLNAIWQEMEAEAIARMARQGFAKEQVILVRQAMVRYGRQLDDLVVTAQVPRMRTARDWDKLINAFEELYGRTYASGARYPQAGYEILEVGLVARVPKIKPVVPKFAIGGERPPSDAIKGKRSCYFNDGWVDTTVYEWGKLRAGNRTQGPALVEHPTTTLVVPPDKAARVDEYLAVWIE